MSVHMRKPPIKKQVTILPVELRFLGPQSKKEKALTSMKSLGFVDMSDSILFREAFPDFHPGDVIQGLRYLEELTQVELAEKTGISRRHISEMENGKRPIGKKNAKVLAKTLRTDYRVFL